MAVAIGFSSAMAGGAGVGALVLGIPWLALAALFRDPPESDRKARGAGAAVAEACGETLAQAVWERALRLNVQVTARACRYACRCWWRTEAGRW